MVRNIAEKVISTNMQKEEQKCLDFLQSSQPHLVPDYFNNLKRGRKEILHKLAAALLREDIEGLYSRSIKMKKIDSIFAIGLDEIDETWEMLIRRLSEFKLREDLTYFIFCFEEQLLVFPVEKEYGFRRIILADDILLINKEKVEAVENTSHLLAAMDALLPDRSAVLQKELENGTANYVLALAIQEQWKRELSAEAGKFDVDTCIQYALSKKDSDSLWSSSLFFEQFAVEGHNLHPGSKTKTGMDPKDVFALSPEFRQSLFICFIAVRKENIISAEIQPGFIESEFSEIKEAYWRQMAKKGFEVSEYCLLPVHEWQYQNVIPELYAEEIDAGTIVLLDGLAIVGAASSSFRTIWPRLFGKPALKLAVNSHMTSTVRSISQQTAMNSVEFTRMMTSILAQEPALKHFQPINEVAGYSFLSENKERTRNLTVIARENFEEKLNPGEVAMPACSLYNLSPVSGKPLIAEILDEYCSHAHCDQKEGAVRFLEDYLSIVVPGFLTLMVKYGVALEGHLQNSVPVFEKGKLVRFYFRDWGGARIYKNRLHQQGIEIAFYPDSVSIASNEQEMREKAYYTIFQNHLGEIIVQLSEYTHLHEKKLWEKVREACDQVFHELHVQGVESARRDADNLYEPFVKHKALASMRLYPESGYRYSSVPNPLAAEGK